jgi:hypothetical protein
MSPMHTTSPTQDLICVHDINVLHSFLLYGGIFQNRSPVLQHNVQGVKNVWTFLLRIQEITVHECLSTQFIKKKSQFQ